MKVKVISLPYIFQVFYALCFTRPRYQVSVYRTNGPLVSHASNKCDIFFRELETVCFRVDELAPDLIDKVKYVLHGDFSHIQDMKTQAEEWANKVKYL